MSAAQGGDTMAEGAALNTEESPRPGNKRRAVS